MEGLQSLRWDAEPSAYALKVGTGGLATDDEADRAVLGLLVSALIIRPPPDQHRVTGAAEKQTAVAEGTGHRQEGGYSDLNRHGLNPPVR